VACIINLLQLEITTPEIDPPNCGITFTTVKDCTRYGSAYVTIVIYSFIVLATRSHCHYNCKLWA